MGKKTSAPAEIEGRYSVTQIDGKPVRQPIFNNWRNALPLLALVAIRAAWVLLSRH